MPSVAIMFNVLPINCKDGFEMIYRIQGDKAVSCPCMWERLERKLFYCGSCSSQGVTYKKVGKTSVFLSAQALLGGGWEESWVGMLQGYCCAEMRGNPSQDEEFGMVTLLPKSICFPKSELNHF